jgi:hypothetical protein
MPVYGASRPLRRIPAIVSFLNPQPALSLVGGNRSSCPKPSSTASSLLAPPDPRRGRVLLPISPPAQPCAIGYFAKISSTRLNALSAAACGVSPSFMIATHALGKTRSFWTCSPVSSVTPKFRLKEISKPWRYK